jgi:hypothetical protein
MLAYSSRGKTSDFKSFSIRSHRFLNFQIALICYKNLYYKKKFKIFDYEYNKITETLISPAGASGVSASFYFILAIMLV